MESRKSKIFVELRLISLYNVRYKIISKFLSNRMSDILPNIISREQGAFMKERIIQENIAIVQEIA